MSISFPVLAAAAFPLHLTQIYDLEINQKNQQVYSQENHQE